MWGMDCSTTFSTSSKSFSEMSGNSILWEGSMMACSLAIWLVMLWNGVFPYVMQYRMHPRDHTSPFGLIFRGEETKISHCGCLIIINCSECWIVLAGEPLSVRFLAGMKCLWWPRGACSSRFQPVSQIVRNYTFTAPFPQEWTCHAT